MFRILSLDGGGIKGAYTAAVLTQFQLQLKEQSKGASLIDHFDLIVGTSTGGIIALGLAAGMEPEKLLSFYVNDGYKIFPPASSRWGGILEWIFGPKYESDELRKLLRKHLPRLRFSELKHRVAITSFDASNANPVVFKTKYHPSLTAHGNLDLVDVALATSAAPTYFASADIDIGVMVDGGVWANCPVMVGVVEAIHMFQQECKDIHVLSIGTTSYPTFVKPDMREGGLLNWVRPAPSLMMHASKLGDLEQAKKLTGSLTRIDDVVPAGLFEMDDVKGVDDLVSLGYAAGRRYWEAVRTKFFIEKADYLKDYCL